MRAGRLVSCVAVAVFGAGAALAGPRVGVIPEGPSPGELFRVEVRGAGSHAEMEARFDGHSFPLWDRGDGLWEGLVVVDRDRAPGPVEMLLVDRTDGKDELVALSEVSVRRREYPVQRLTVAESMVTLSPEDQERAAREAALIREALSRRTPRRLWAPPALIPADGPVSGAFGVRRVYNGKPRGYHGGLDIAAPRGAPVHATAAGVVALVGNFFYTGHTVFVDHGMGLLTAYFHLDSAVLSEGEAVAAGDLVGRVGSTGRSTGPHLHWGVYLAGTRADPLSLVRATRTTGAGGE